MHQCLFKQTKCVTTLTVYIQVVLSSLEWIHPYRYVLCNSYSLGFPVPFPAHCRRNLPKASGRRSHHYALSSTLVKKLLIGRKLMFTHQYALYSHLTKKLLICSRQVSTSLYAAHWADTSHVLSAATDYALWRRLVKAP